MTDPELRRTLAALRPPAPDPAARDRALHRATLALDSAPVAERRSRFASLSTLLAFPTLATIAAALLLAPLALIRPDSPTGSPSPAVATTASAAALLAELETLFPGQLDAVIDQDGTLQLDLADQASATSPADQALLVELVRADGHRLRVLSYSGRSVDIELDGLAHRFEALLGGTGDIILAGPDFVWTASAPRPLAGWSVNAHALAPVL